MRDRLRITMNPDIHLVLRLQSLDTRVSDLEKEVATLPKHIAEIEKTFGDASAPSGS